MSAAGDGGPRPRALRGVKVATDGPPRSRPAPLGIDRLIPARDARDRCGGAAHPGRWGGVGRARADFWGHHALLAGLASSVITVVITVALVNEAVERRKRQRWSVLAQYVMLQLVPDARLVWTGVAQLASLMPPGTYTAASMDLGATAVRDTVRLGPAIRELVADADRRQRLRDEIALLVAQSDEVLGRWAAVMLNVDAYAEVIDRRVELASDLAWLARLLGHLEPPDDQRCPRRGRSHTPIQVEGEVDHQRLADTLLALTQLAERLDRGTLELAHAGSPCWLVGRAARDDASGPDRRARGGDRRSAASYLIARAAGSAGASSSVSQLQAYAEAFARPTTENPMLSSLAWRRTSFMRRSGRRSPTALRARRRCGGWRIAAR